MHKSSSHLDFKEICIKLCQSKQLQLTSKAAGLRDIQPIICINICVYVSLVLFTFMFKFSDFKWVDLSECASIVTQPAFHNWWDLERDNASEEAKGLVFYLQKLQMKRRSSFSKGQKRANCAKARKNKSRSSKAVLTKTKDISADMKETLKMFRQPIISISAEEQQAALFHFLKEPARKKHPVEPTSGAVEPMKRSSRKSVSLTYVDGTTEVSRSTIVQTEGATVENKAQTARVKPSVRRQSQKRKKVKIAVASVSPKPTKRPVSAPNFHAAEPSFAATTEQSAVAKAVSIAAAQVPVSVTQASVFAVKPTNSFSNVAEASGENMCSARDLEVAVGSS